MYTLTPPASGMFSCLPGLILTRDTGACGFLNSLVNPGPLSQVLWFLEPMRLDYRIVF